MIKDEELKLKLLKEERNKYLEIISEIKDPVKNDPLIDAMYSFEVFKHLYKKRLETNIALYFIDFTRVFSNFIHREHKGLICSFERLFVFRRKKQKSTMQKLYQHTFYLN